MTADDLLMDLLRKTSRTFALTIPFLPEPTRREVGVAYLLFRVIDSFEDATLWAPERRIEALGQFVQLMRQPTEVAACTASWVREPPLEHAGYQALIELTPTVLAWHESLEVGPREQIRTHLIRTAQGMADFVGRTNGVGALRLETLPQLQEYCFVVAGIVGQLLTELYLLGQPQLAGIASELRNRAERFGEGLQLVNILKDAAPDAAEGRVFLPERLPISEIFALARADLVAALEYTELLRWAKADFGVVAFNALNARLALATLRVLREDGPGSKLSRIELSGLADDVIGSINTGASLLPDP